jgi:hypothetical protein
MYYVFHMHVLSAGPRGVESVSFKPDSPTLVLLRIRTYVCRELLCSMPVVPHVVCLAHAAKPFFCSGYSEGANLTDPDHQGG